MRLNYDHLPDFIETLTMRLSAILITHNEQAHIVDCLKALDFADEIIVVDAASTDQTAALARQLGAQVHVTPDWPGFGAQKNRALALAKGDWVLSVDADERVPPALRDEILAVVAQNQGAQVYRFPRRSSYCGQFMQHSGWSPDWVVRLFKRGSAQFSNDVVHEKLCVQGAVGDLKTPLVHLSFPDFESVLDKANRYSSAGAVALRAKGKSATLWGALGHGAWAFFRTYVLRRGFLDGQLGLALAISNAEGTYYRYAKRWLMTRHEIGQ
ncbi:glycosyltransferase family 2 protein [Rhodoferax sp.]|uniref:glycosyltransferase family 2 protein n=1 Tax=Rhodoferax sp. TaxID=50421 RepID=UPI00261110F5|nr:glycosyltransferase family 2 protein [Rhodoferax sp.]